MSLRPLRPGGAVERLRVRVDRLYRPAAPDDGRRRRAGTGERERGEPLTSATVIRFPERW